jgi:hypothetical protein
MRNFHPVGLFIFLGLFAQLRYAVNRVGAGVVEVGLEVRGGRLWFFGGLSVRFMAAFVHLS